MAARPRRTDQAPRPGGAPLPSPPCSPPSPTLSPCLSPLAHAFSLPSSPPCFPLAFSALAAALGGVSPLLAPSIVVGFIGILTVPQPAQGLGTAFPHYSRHCRRHWGACGLQTNTTKSHPFLEQRLLSFAGTVSVDPDLSSVCSGGCGCTIRGDFCVQQRGVAGAEKFHASWLLFKPQQRSTGVPTDFLLGALSTVRHPELKLNIPA